MHDHLIDERFDIAALETLEAALAAKVRWADSVITPFAFRARHRALAVTLADSPPRAPHIEVKLAG